MQNSALTLSENAESDENNLQQAIMLPLALFMWRDLISAKMYFRLEIKIANDIITDKFRTQMLMFANHGTRGIESVLMLQSISFSEISTEQCSRR